MGWLAFLYRYKTQQQAIRIDILGIVAKSYKVYSLLMSFRISAACRAIQQFAISLMPPPHFDCRWVRQKLMHLVENPSVYSLLISSSYHEHCTCS
jgi:hypothetical protein